MEVCEGFKHHQHNLTRLSLSLSYTACVCVCIYIYCIYDYIYTRTVYMIKQVVSTKTALWLVLAHVDVRQVSQPSADTPNAKVLIASFLTSIQYEVSGIIADLLLKENETHLSYSLVTLGSWFAVGQNNNFGRFWMRLVYSGGQKPI